MASTAVTYESLTRRISQGDVSGVYLLHGEEGFYIDRLVENFEKLLPEADREFDLHIYYGAQADPYRVIDCCRQWPLVSGRQIVILKEAQAMNADKVNRLASYVLDQTDTTVFVISFRGAPAKGKDLIAAAKSKATIFESKKIADYNVGAVLSGLINERGLQADFKASEMLREYIGNDISRLYNEIDKLAMILGQGGKITPEVVEKNIGVSKDYNNFELVDALAVKDAAKAFRIAEYFRSNPKNNPLVLTCAAIFSFFSDLLVMHYCRDKSDAALQAALKLRSSFQLRRFKAAQRYYNAAQVIEIISQLRRFDAMSKGIGSRQLDHRLFKDLIYHILTARGKLPV